ncbi:hypothetical protein A5784_36120 [Mycobacterium sp. 852013-50091_SCH5140682]|uniref:flavin reductase family protein n=1 Tax=Mycobacterium sp. 852013-50091_SCH5140682 TaxID=1834109 RepID=UPI0007E986C4|nr:flavin reductase family protein [Mycobacterium sp. 852013-50091_SCH5140682]OBC10929.1 hypothetical protein A5784_36120 [Mycobacterium sp. 852013-50091_SCH5140682]
MESLPADVVTAETIRSVLGHFPTGVIVVTAHTVSGPVGMTLQSFISLSLDPPLVLLSVAKTSTSWPRIAESDQFVVNVLSEGQSELARQFARSGADKFEGVDCEHDPRLGGPLLAGVSAWVNCQAEAQYDGGDHTIVVARVLAASVAEPPSDHGHVAPLVFHRSSFPRLSPDSRPSNSKGTSHQ